MLVLALDFGSGIQKGSLTDAICPETILFVLLMLLLMLH